MSEPTNLEDLLRRQLLLQEKLLACLSNLGSLKDSLEDGLKRQSQEAGLTAIARQMAIANDDRRAEKERERMQITGWLRPPAPPSVLTERDIMLARY